MPAIHLGEDDLQIIQEIHVLSLSLSLSLSLRFIYSRETHRERQRYRQREKQAPCGKPVTGFNPRTLGSRLEPKVDGSTTEPPGAPSLQDFK